MIFRGGVFTSRDSEVEAPRAEVKRLRAECDDTEQREAQVVRLREQLTGADAMVKRLALDLKLAREDRRQAEAKLKAVVEALQSEKRVNGWAGAEEAHRVIDAALAAEQEKPS